MLEDRDAPALAPEQQEGRMRSVGVGEIAVAVDAEELCGGELRRQRNAEQEIVEPRHERRQRHVRLRLGVDVAFQQRDENGRGQSVSGDIGHEEVDLLVLLEIVVEVAGQRLARHVRGADLEPRCVEGALRHERLLHAPRDLQVARDLVVEFAELVLVGLHAQQGLKARQQDLGEATGRGANVETDTPARVEHRIGAEMIEGSRELYPAARDVGMRRLGTKHRVSGNLLRWPCDNKLVGSHATGGDRALRLRAAFEQAALDEKPVNANAAGHALCSAHEMMSGLPLSGTSEEHSGTNNGTCLFFQTTRCEASRRSGR